LRLKDWLERPSIKRMNLLIILAWIAIVSLVVIKTHWITYTKTPRIIYYKVAFTIYEGPTLSVVDFLIIIFAGFVVGLAMSDIRTLFYGYLLSMLCVFMIGVIYVAIFIWYVFSWGELFGAISYGWEWVILLGMLETFRIIFPWVVGVCLISLAIGFFAKSWILPT